MQTKRQNGLNGCLRGGFTFIELLIVICVIGVLVALLLPAVHATREAARRFSCVNNLAQIGIALQNYHDEHGVFPSAYQTRIGGDSIMGKPDPFTRDAGPGWAYSMQILPYMEHGPLYHSFNIKLPCWSDANSTAAQTSVATYLCPSVPFLSIPFQATDGNGKALAILSPSSYVSNAGRADAWSAGVDDLSTIPTVDGPFYRNSAVGIADILDGTAFTIMVGERTPSVGDATWVGVVPGTMVCSILRASMPTGAAAPPSCKAAGALVGVHSGPSPYESPSIAHPPNSGIWHADEMSSAHPGGVNVLFGDGSVRFMKSSLSLATWTALSTRNGGEMLADIP